MAVIDSRTAGKPPKSENHRELRLANDQGKTAVVAKDASLDDLVALKLMTWQPESTWIGDMEATGSPDLADSTTISFLGILSL